MMYIKYNIQRENLPKVMGTARANAMLTLRPNRICDSIWDIIT